MFDLVAEIFQWHAQLPDEVAIIPIVAIAVIAFIRWLTKNKNGGDGYQTLL